MKEGEPLTGHYYLEISMSEELSFLNQIACNPEDENLRLAFSDWLRDRGETDRADFFREPEVRWQTGLIGEYYAYTEDFTHRLDWDDVLVLCGVPVGSSTKNWRVWSFYDAPQILRELSPHGGDEDWVLLCKEGEWVNWAQSGSQFGVCDVSEHRIGKGWEVRIGAHS